MKTWPCTCTYNYPVGTKHLHGIELLIHNKSSLNDQQKSTKNWSNPFLSFFPSLHNKTQTRWKRENVVGRGWRVGACFEFERESLGLFGVAEASIAASARTVHSLLLNLGNPFWVQGPIQASLRDANTSTCFAWVHFIPYL